MPRCSIGVDLNMTVLQWTPDLEIGVFELDLQHRSLIGIVNQLHEAILANRAPRTIEWIMEELLLYTKFHFDTEEAYMHRYQLECVASHQLEHEEVLKVVRRLKRKLKAGGDGIPDAVHEWLHAWLLKHLMGTDRGLGMELQARMSRSAS